MYHNEYHATLKRKQQRVILNERLVFLKEVTKEFTKYDSSSKSFSKICKVT